MCHKKVFLIEYIFSGQNLLLQQRKFANNILRT